MMIKRKIVCYKLSLSPIYGSVHRRPVFSHNSVPILILIFILVICYERGRDC